MKMKDHLVIKEIHQTRKTFCQKFRFDSPHLLIFCLWPIAPIGVGFSFDLFTFSRLLPTAYCLVSSVSPLPDIVCFF